MTVPHTSSSPSPLWLRLGFWICLIIGAAAVIRRLFALASQAHHGPPQMAGLDDAFASHTALTLAHIIPAILFVMVAPFAVFSRFARLRGPDQGAQRPVSVAGVAERVLFPLGVVVGLTAYAMATYAVGGWIERSGIYLFDSLFLFSLARSFRYRQLGEPPSSGAGSCGPSPSCSVSEPRAPSWGSLSPPAVSPIFARMSFSGSRCGWGSPSICSSSNSGFGPWIAACRSRQLPSPLSIRRPTPEESLYDQFRNGCTAIRVAEASRSAAVAAVVALCSVIHRRPVARHGHWRFALLARPLGIVPNHRFLFPIARRQGAGLRLPANRSQHLPGLVHGGCG